MVLRLGLLVNPIAGIGGPAALKGSDDVAEQAAEAGYPPSAPDKATRFLRRLRERAGAGDVRIFAAPGVLGSGIARAASWKVGTLGADLLLDDPFATDATDSEDAAREALAAEMDLLVFVGGDGTARDIARAIGTGLPVLGIPAGVKMFSECFAETPEAAADLVAELAAPPFDEGTPLDTVVADVLDLDEEAYRAGEMRVRHHAALAVPRSPRVQSGKCPACPQEGLAGAVGEIVARMGSAPEALYVIASGSTTLALTQALGIDGTLIGVDVVTGHPDADGIRWEAVAHDADAHRLEALVQEAEAAGRRVVLVVSPIGGQGFILGRGTGQITPSVVRAALPDRLWILATSGKLGTLQDGRLRVDSGDPSLDEAFPAYLRVVTGAAHERLLPVRPAAAHRGA